MRNQNPSYVPAHIDREVEIPAPKRAVIMGAYADRVRDALKMLFAGKCDSCVQQKHGGIVLAEARFSYEKYWKSLRYNSEGRAFKN